MMTNVRWGILGTGNIAGQFADAMPTARRGRVVAVGSRTQATAGAFAAAHRIQRACGSYEQLIDLPEVDAVYLSLPNSLHHAWTIAALRGGKHVLCEKPIASNATEASEMFDVARDCRRVLIEAFMYRSHPQTAGVLELVRGGAIGDLKLVRTSFCFRTTRTTDNIRFNRALAGGALMDVGCYCINFSRLFAGEEPTHLHAVGNLHEHGVDESAAGILKFRTGVTASFACGMTTQADNTAYVCGSEGYIEIPVPWKPPVKGATYRLRRSAPPKMDGADPAAAVVQPESSWSVDAPASLYALEADDFAAAILDGTAPRVKSEDSIGNMRVLDELRRQVLTSNH